MNITKAKIKQADGTLSDWVPIGADARNVKVVITLYQTDIVGEENTITTNLQDAIDNGYLERPPLQWTII